MLKNQKHIFGGPFYLYMGATPGDITSSNWPVLATTIFMSFYFFSLLTYSVLKARSWNTYKIIFHLFRKLRSGGIVGANNTSMTESSANGVTFFGKIVSFIFGVLFIVIWLSAIEVGLALPLVFSSRTSNSKRQRLESWPYRLDSSGTCCTRTTSRLASWPWVSTSTWRCWRRAPAHGSSGTGMSEDLKMGPYKYSEIIKKKYTSLKKY